MRKLTMGLSATWFLTLATLAGMTLAGCSDKVQSVSGVQMTESGKITLDEHKRTVEQSNIVEKIQNDNKPGSLKHLYVISAYSGQTILYSPVRGKVTSSDKRLSPKKLTGTSSTVYPTLKVGTNTYYVDELPGEDGTFGHSGEYLYWFTPQGIFHQHYLGGGQIVHISDQPISVGKVIITTETSTETQ